MRKKEDTIRKIDKKSDSIILIDIVTYIEIGLNVIYLLD